MNQFRAVRGIPTLIARRETSPLHPPIRRHQWTMTDSSHRLLARVRLLGNVCATGGRFLRNLYPYRDPRVLSKSPYATVGTSGTAEGGRWGAPPPRLLFRR